MLTLQDYKMVNGMSNKYWGWGLEDDEFYLRLRFVHLYPSDGFILMQKLFILRHERLKCCVEDHIISLEYCEETDVDRSHTLACCRQYEALRHVFLFTLLTLSKSFILMRFMVFSFAVTDFYSYEAVLLSDLFSHFTGRNVRVGAAS